MLGRRSLGIFAIAGLASLLLAACSGKTVPAGGVMVAFSSDMSIPKDIDTLHVEITQNGVLLFEQDYQIGPTPLQTIPATLLVTPPSSNQGSPVQVRVVALQNQKPRMLRDAIAVVPTDRVIELRMPVEWLCDGTAALGPPSSSDTATYVSTQCSEGQTCVAGTCTGATVDSSTLPVYSPPDIFGGAPAPASSGTCFDTVSCFASPTLASVSPTCTIPVPTGGTAPNVALLVGTTSTDGICGSAGCFIPLDGNSAEGWQSDGATIQLPMAVCTKITSGLVAGVATTTICATKTAGVPTCGPWSSVAAKGYPIRDVFNPASPDHPQSGAPVAITGATYLLTDTYDETKDGRSIGSVYLEDVPAPTPLAFSGALLAYPTYEPGSLTPVPGNLVDLTGAYVAATMDGAAVLPTGTALVEILRPLVNVRSGSQLPTPLVIQAGDLDDYTTGQQWNSMLCTIEGITFPDGLATDAQGRETIHIMSDTSTNGPTLDNELFDLGTWNTSDGNPLAQGKTIQSVTGIVTWYFNYHIAPRSPADIVAQ